MYMKLYFETIIWAFTPERNWGLETERVARKLEYHKIYAQET